jgi:hypothetical protein
MTPVCTVIPRDFFFLAPPRITLTPTRTLHDMTVVPPLQLKSGLET